MGSTSDSTLNFSNWESWIDLTVLNQITVIEQKCELAVVESKGSQSRQIDFII